MVMVIKYQQTPSRHVKLLQLQPPAPAPGPGPGPASVGLKRRNTCCAGFLVDYYYYCQPQFRNRRDNVYVASGALRMN